MWRDQNVLLTSIERNRHTQKSDMSNRYCREMKSARWFSVKSSWRDTYSKQKVKTL